MNKPSDRAIAQAFYESLRRFHHLTATQFRTWLLDRAREIDAAAKPRTGACENKRKPGGCQLHNLHCGYPKCDEFPADAAAPEGAQGAVAVVTGFRKSGDKGPVVEWEIGATVRIGAKLYTTPPQPQDAEDAAAVVTAQFAALLPGPYYMDPPDGGDVTVLEQIRRMAEDAARYRLIREKITGDPREWERFIDVIGEEAQEDPAAFDRAIDAARGAGGGGE